MNYCGKIFIMAIFLFLTSCYTGINGIVVDAVTGKPIKGAIVVAQWTTTHGLGLTYQTLYKIEETETDDDGKFRISGVHRPFVDQPEMVIYKKGYVPWRNDMTFEKMETYKKVIWQNNATYKLEHWRDEYSKLKLDIFVASGFIGSDIDKTPKFSAIKTEISKDSQAEIDARKKKIMK